MASIGLYTLPHHSTAVDVQTRFVEGRVKKVVRFDTILLGRGDRAEFSTELEFLEGEVDRVDRGEASLSIHSDRYHNGIRLSLQKTVDLEDKFAAYEILFLTEDRFERGSLLREVVETIDGAEETIELSHDGNVDAMPLVILEATGDLAHPSISDGARTLTYAATLSAGRVLTIDCDRKTATLDDGSNALAKVSGSFPVIDPSDGTWTYSDDESSSHQGRLTIQYRDTWV